MLILFESIVTFVSFIACFCEEMNTYLFVSSTTRKHMTFLKRLVGSSIKHLLQGIAATFSVSFATVYLQEIHIHKEKKFVCPKQFPVHLPEKPTDFVDIERMACSPLRLVWKLQLFFMLVFFCRGQTPSFIVITTEGNLLILMKLLTF